MITQYNSKQKNETQKKINKRVNPDKFDNSNKEHNEWFRESYDIWIKMLKYAVDNNKSIIFG